MNTSIWKTALPTIGVPFGVPMPEGSVIIDLQMQYGRVPTMWFECDPAAPMVTVPFAWAGTGDEMLPDPPRRHVGTLQFHDGTLVLHLYDLTPTGTAARPLGEG